MIVISLKPAEKTANRDRMGVHLALAAIYITLADFSVLATNGG